jgi:hypothetical protein
MPTDASLPSLEPARLISLVNAALLATFAVVVFVTKMQPEAAAVVSAALGAWVALAGEFIRSKVTPTVKVALTKDEAAALDAVGVIPAPVVPPTIPGV